MSYGFLAKKRFFARESYFIEESKKFGVSDQALTKLKAKEEVRINELKRLKGNQLIKRMQDIDKDRTSELYNLMAEHYGAKSNTTSNEQTEYFDSTIINNSYVEETEKRYGNNVTSKQQLNRGIGAAPVQSVKSDRNKTFNPQIEPLGKIKPIKLGSGDNLSGARRAIDKNLSSLGEKGAGSFYAGSLKRPV